MFSKLQVNEITKETKYENLVELIRCHRKILVKYSISFSSKVTVMNKEIARNDHGKDLAEYLRKFL